MDLGLLENIIRGAPILEELTLQLFHFDDPAMLHSVAMVLWNDSSPDLKCHLNDCRFHPNTIPIWQEIVSWEKTKFIRVTVELRNVGDIELLRSIISESSCVRALDVTVTDFFANFTSNGGPVLEMVKILQEQTFSSPYPLMSVKLLINTKYVKQYHEVIESIPQWTPCVKKLHLNFMTDDLLTSGQHIRKKL